MGIMCPATPVTAQTAVAVLEFALAQRNKPHVYRSSGPDSWDCSSLVQAAYRHATMQIGRTGYEQAKAGRGVIRRIAD